MALLDRFRSLPAHKHADPEVRLAYIESLSIDEREDLALAACQDESARVRRAAVLKLMDPAVLATVARDDVDAGVRTSAASMLRDIALEAFEETGEAQSLAAVEALATLSDLRIIAQIAKTATREAVAQRALARIADSRMLGSIARHAALESIRGAAFHTLNDHEEIIAVAMNSEFKDTAVAAVEGLTDRAELEQIAGRSNHKGAAKRARGILRELDERAAREAASIAVVPELAEEPARLDDAATTRRRDEEEEMAKAEAARAARAELERVEQERAAIERQRVEEVARQRAEALAAERAAAQAAAQEKAARDAAAKEADARARRKALDGLHRLLDRIEPLTTKDDGSVKVVERALREVRGALGAIPPLPSKADYDEVTRRLKAMQAALVPKLQDLRAMEDWQRWANVGIQEALCEKMETLKAQEDVGGIARRVRELQQQWRQAADVPRAQGESLWRRFKAAHDEVWPRCVAHFAAQAAASADSHAKKIALCERVEALADSTNWLQTAEEIQRLQAEWKTIGSASKGQDKQLWERFRLACDRFFTRRHEDLARRKATWADNLGKKEALCAMVEALAQSTEWDASAMEIKRIQAEWKTIGPVKKSRSDAIWQRFRDACDHFFSRYAQRHEIARGERVAAREAICGELEALASNPPDDPAPPTDVVAAVRALRSRWQHEITLRGVEPQRAAALDERFLAAFNGVLVRWPHAFSGTDLDPDANQQRLEALVQRAEDLASALAGPSGGDEPLTPTAKLATMLKEALAANTIGGKAHEENRWRAAQEDVRQAQAAWSRVGPVPEPTRRALTDRFQRACGQILEKSGGAGGSGRAAR